MAIANLHETILAYKLRRNQLNLEITEFQSQKSLATYSTADLESLKSAEKHSIRDYFKELYENDKKYCDMNITFVKNFLYKKDSFAKRCEVLPIFIEDNDEI